MLPPQIMDRARPPRLGLIRLGIKVPLVREGRPVVKNGSPVTIPQEVDYFVLPDTLRAALGDQPKTLRVLFPFDDPDQNLTASYTVYAGALLTLRCDGRTCVEIPKEGPERHGPCRRTDQGCDCGAKAKGRLSVIVIDGPVGIYQVLIGGLQRIADLWTGLRVYQQIFRRLTDIPFTLERVPADVQVRREDGTRLARTGWPVQLRCSFTVAEALRARRRDLAALPETTTTWVEEDDDQADPDDPTGAPAASPGPDPEPEPEPWTLERCYRAAASVGLSAVDYGTYLQHTYKTPDLNITALSQQGDLLASLTNNPEAVQSFTVLVQRIVAGGRR